MDHDWYKMMDVFYFSFQKECEKVLFYHLMSKVRVIEMMKEASGYIENWLRSKRQNASVNAAASG